MSVVIDTSALICLIKKENGFEKVENYMLENVYISSVNLAEFYSWISQNEIIDIELAVELIQELGILVVDFDENMSIRVAKTIQTTKKFGLSLGDRACLTLSEHLKLKCITCDKIWQNLNQDFDIEVLR